MAHPPHHAPQAPNRPAEVIVVGAGWGGLAAASTYERLARLLNRSINLSIIDAHSAAGGVWSPDRLYPGLYAHTPTGLFEYGDATMVDAEHPRYSPLSGYAVGEYLQRYARDKGLWERCHFDERVVRVVRRGDGPNTGWHVRTVRVDGDGDKDGAGTTDYECDILLLAPGLYTRPRPLPSLPSPGTSNPFTGKSLHSTHMGRELPALVSDDSIRHVLVVGSAKSAAEACSLFLPGTSGQERGRFSVTWLVAPSPRGRGVTFLLADLANPGAEKALTRAASCIHSSLWDHGAGGMYEFLHSGRWLVGSWLVAIFWALLDCMVGWSARKVYGKSGKGEVVRPSGVRTGVEWEILNCVQLPPHHELVKALSKGEDGMVEMKRARVKGLSGREATLADEAGREEGVPCDAVLWCTGWLPSVDFFEGEERERMGAPMPLEGTDTKQVYLNSDINLTNSSMVAAADKRVMELFPRLKDPHPPPDRPPKHTPYALFRNIISPWCLTHDDRSIAFVDMSATGATAIAAQLSALWAAAWCQGMLDRKAVLGLDTGTTNLEHRADVAEDAIEREAYWQTAQEMAFLRRRWGEKQSQDLHLGPAVQAYADRLCLDLEVKVERKRTGKEQGFRQSWRAWAREWFEGYEAKDYEGVVEEFFERWKKREGRREGERKGDSLKLVNGADD
ncbi:uncharacterized protein HMPREF1541_04395 [Cyphellophora europaea CBS 101466]|uniref:FAD/NAD(P)-binding domain-containing protein n=1 Tax=Cyphellophora europaea (strain CBS 101466) TaxID=1220924 RepID=W2RUY8_CYPE1|nr:uncharacterized protein HMPREF1541_04395 [Cyphellophora europaea CBS 101466]ETN40120.1 hypothetical protein HMPREF1541_04395 [Cyphellophora europaea CBS 101466]